jgi:hypothetical protein
MIGVAELGDDDEEEGIGPSRGSTRTTAVVAAAATLAGPSKRGRRNWGRGRKAGA